MTTKDAGIELVVDFEAHRYRNGALEPYAAPVAREVPYTLFVNDREILSIATLPSHLEELFVGFLVSEGVLERLDELVECTVDHRNKLAIVELDVPTERVDKMERKGMLTSGCAGGMTFSVEAAARGGKGHRPSSMTVGCSAILKRMYELDTFKGIYSTTKGVHASSVATSAETLMILEDLGRHNAVDKIVGYCFLNRIDTADKLLLTTGRITSEVLSKASRGGFPIIISRSSASSLALQIAAQCAVDIVSYVRGGRFNYFANQGVDLVSD
jgi:FdhD protein